MEPIQSNKIYPIGIQNFEKMRKGGYFYVDKTALVYRLVKTGSYYFLSRPRRFGKSLLISTLEAYFQGKKELFEGLAMEKLEKDWIKRPVLHIDLNIGKYDTPDSLDKQLEKAVTEWEQLYGTGMAESTLALRFAGVVRRACEQTGQRVAILIDEYDKPMLQAIGNKALQNEFRNTLKPFYGVLKTMDGCIQFALLTGVTKFGKVSVFSDLNNLNDISMDRRYLALCGVTDEELRQEFAPSIRLLAQAQNMTYEETCQRLQKDYDGYHFTHNSIGIYNLQPAQHLRQAGVRQLLVRDGHPHLSGGTAETQPLQPGGDGPCRNLRRRAEQHLWRRRPTARHLPKRIPHD